MPIRRFIALLCAFWAWSLGHEARADVPVDVELVLAVDVSRSMDRSEQALQREGYAEALLDAEVLRAIQAGFVGRVALTYVEWSGPDEQRVVVPWGLVEDRNGARAFVEALQGTPSKRGRYTSISSSLEFAAGLFEGNGIEGMRRVIDVSGDGPNNTGYSVTRARDDLVGRGIVINGLPLMLRPYSSGVNNVLLDLEAYYRDCVIGGPGSFLVPVRHADELKEAIKRKLILEIASAAPLEHAGVVLAQQRRSATDCASGERNRPQWMNDP